MFVRIVLKAIIKKSQKLSNSFQIKRDYPSVKLSENFRTMVAAVYHSLCVFEVWPA
jgi:hypothetical protein